MAATPQSQALETANHIVSCGQQMMTLYNLIKVVQANWTDDEVATYLQALQTAPVQPDGSLGPADTTPKPANPINPTTYPVLTRAMAFNQYNQLKTVLDGL